VRRAGAGAIVAVALALALPAAAQGEEAQVDLFATAFNPATLTVVAGDTVTWRNGDIVVHDVKGPGFSSGVIGRFESFSQRVETPGTVSYVCSLHLGMGAQLEVLAAKLQAPSPAAFKGETVALQGRSAPGAAVTIERDAGGWQPAGTVTAGADGTFKASVTAAKGYRARTTGGESPAVAAKLLPAPKVMLTAAEGRLKVTTTPAAKGLTVRFQERGRSGWRKFASKKLDAAGRASVAERAGKLRAVLTRGKTALATSKTLRR
jgi:plastocyanin